MKITLGKKGAIELSMNTIIIVVIGITILTLGLRWIYGVFENLSGQSEEIGRMSEQQIRDMFKDPEAVIYLSTTTPAVKKGKECKANIIVRNIYPEKHKFKHIVETDERLAADTVRWYSKEFELTSGEGFKDIIIFNTKSLALGTHSFRVKATCLDCTPIEEKSEPLILDVIP